MPSLSNDLARAADLLRAATRIASLSGAGLSKASGIATYRDQGGLWTEAGNLKYSQAENLRLDPEGFRAFWAARRAEVAPAQPNAGHLAFAQLQALRPGTVHATQNIDGLLTRAGCDGVLELHGNLMRDRCLACDAPAVPHVDGASRCTQCGGELRPDVVLFGEMLPARVWADAEMAAKRSEVFVVAGTSALVHPAAGLPARALSRGAKRVVVNAEATPLDADADVVLRGPCETLLPALVEAMRAG
jgi:NAD-dependent deacetylase